MGPMVTRGNRQACTSSLLTEKTRTISYSWIRRFFCFSLFPVNQTRLIKSSKQAKKEIYYIGYKTNGRPLRR